MADANETQATEGKKRRKPQGPRQAKPIFAVISYTDEEGNDVRLDVERLNIEFTKDSSELVQKLTGPDAGKLVVKSVTLPTAQRKAPTA